jgi:G:T/U-mismatch repair DNA glycosylase
MEDRFTLETMPVPPFLEGRPSALIIGTFPPSRERWDYPFFFPNKQNRLWNTLARVSRLEADYLLPDFADPAAEVAARQDILRSLDAAMVNIIQQCERKNGSALDNDLRVLALEHIADDILRQHAGIERIFLTSMSGPNSCLSLLKRHLRDHRIQIRPFPKPGRTRAEKIEDPIVFSFDIYGRTISVYSLYSPSPTAMRAGITEADLYRQYLKLRQP